MSYGMSLGVAEGFQRPVLTSPGHVNGMREPAAAVPVRTSIRGTVVVFDTESERFTLQFLVSVVTVSSSPCPASSTGARVPIHLFRCVGERQVGRFSTKALDGIELVQCCVF